MAKAVVAGTIEGSPGAEVVIKLLTPGNGYNSGQVPSEDYTISAPIVIAADESGDWEAELEPNVHIVPSNSKWEVRIRNAYGHVPTRNLIEVPSSGGPFRFEDLVGTVTTDFGYGGY